MSLLFTIGAIVAGIVVLVVAYAIACAFLESNSH